MPEITVDIDTSNLERQLQEKDQEIEALESKGVKVISFIEKKSRETFRRAITMAHGVWMVIDNVMQAFGVNVSAQFRGLISAGISTVSILSPLLSAEMMTPGMQAQAILGFFNLALAVTALAAAQQQEAEFARTALQINQSLHGVSSIIGQLDMF